MAIATGSKLPAANVISAGLEATSLTDLGKGKKR